MGELASYRLSDFILFSQTVYYRQFELYNQAIWPLHIVAICFALVILYALWKKPAWGGQLVALVLAVSWLWVAWAFLYQRFYQIHVVADWYAFGFVLQAGLVAWYGVLRNRFAPLVKNQLRTNIGSGLLFTSFIFYPFIALIAGRSWMQLEMFALAPDPTALATFAVLLFYKVPVVLYAIPIIWMLFSTVTLIVM
jgi:hypothetical protein